MVLASPAAFESLPSVENFFPERLKVPFSQSKSNAASHPVAGVPGAVAPGEINFDSPPSPPGKGVGGISFPFGEGGQEIKLK